MIAVSNTGTLIALAKVDALPLLKAVFAEVRPVLEEMRRRGYWLSDALLDEAARLAGEQETG